LRLFELGFSLSALLRMVGHGFLLEEIATTRLASSSAFRARTSAIGLFMR
jgi:hypothetical protein